MPKVHAVADALVINDENDRILELWFRARASVEFCEKHSPSDFLFVANIAGQEDRKTLAGALNYAERAPEQIDVCFLCRKVTLSLPLLELLCNSSHTVQLYARPPQEEALDGAAPTTAKQRKAGGKKDRAKREEDLFVIENADQLFSLSFDLIELLTLSSTRRSVPVPLDAMLQDCFFEVRCGTPFLPPAKLDRYRPLKIEVRSVHDLPRTEISQDPLFLTVRFGDTEIRSPELCLEANGKVGFCRVMFLGTRTPLDVYQDVFFRRLEVSVFKGARMCLGKGTVLLRAAVTDRQREFSELVYLLPSRTTVFREDNCLSKGTMVSLRVDFFTPLPCPTHVLSNGLPAHGHFLTRGIIRMPYAAKWVPIVLEAFIATLLQLKRAYKGSNVYQYEMPAPVPDAVPVKEKKKESGKSPRNQSMSPPRPPSPTAFDAPFKIVTPPGISGFEVMDENIRIICVEGLAVEVHQIIERISAVAGRNSQLELLMNAELFVPARAYNFFPPLVTLPKTMNADALKLGIGKGTDSAGGATSTAVHGGFGSEGEFMGDATDVSYVPSFVSSKGPNGSTGEPFDSAGAEAGGTGGRIHRIRIGETIESLASKQHYLLRRMLSDACLSCYTKLHALCECSSLRTIFERDLFPTAEELIALERSFGLTLELSDVFGKQEFVSVAVEKDPAGSLKYAAADESGDSHYSTIKLNALRWNDVGKMVSFEARKIIFSKRRVPACVQQRYPGACWMLTSDNNTTVLCAFPTAAQPKETIRYLVEAQVVRCGEMLCLYALACDSLAKSCTNSHNAAYEAYLRTSRKQKMRLHSKKGEEKLANSTTNRIRNGSLCSEFGGSADNDSSVDFLSFEMPTVPQSAVTVRRDLVDRSRRTVQLRTKKASGPTAADYELCWELYRQRAPTVRPKPPRGPPMRF
ncbi:hypothetical protein BCY84_01164 [Trypanosoma cruzi cruzi]|nr:hypothetical protein BCY84_01164 [Trypanosoma cruzi cruzi]